MKMPIGWQQDDHVKREMSTRQKIGWLEARRDQLLDHGFINRAKAIENQIRALKRDIGAH